MINGLPVQVTPNAIFSYNKKGKDHIGAVWFVAKKDSQKNKYGYTPAELAMLADGVHRYLEENFGSKYEIDTTRCVAVDVMLMKEVNYEEVMSGAIISDLDSCIAEIYSMI